MRDSWTGLLDKLIVTTGALLVLVLAVVTAVFAPERRRTWL